MNLRNLLQSTKNKAPLPADLDRSGYVLITGASQGLGKALALEFARRGMNLILVALPGEGLPSTAQAITELYGVHVEAVESDLTAQGSAEALHGWVVEKELPVVALVNNAGVGYNRRFEDSSLRENEVCILLNNLALVKITRLLLPILKSQPRAHILNVASMAALFPMPYMPVYGPSKAFILSFSLGLREEMRNSGVSVSVLVPNGIRTNAAVSAQIASYGWAARATCQNPDEIARYAVARMLAGAATIVPGKLNQMIGKIGPYVPRALIFAVVSSFWGKTATQKAHA